MVVTGPTLGYQFLKNYGGREKEAKIDRVSKLMNSKKEKEREGRRRRRRKKGGWRKIRGKRRK